MGYSRRHAIKLQGAINRRVIRKWGKSIQVQVLQLKEVLRLLVVLAAELGYRHKCKIVEALLGEKGFALKQQESAPEKMFSVILLQVLVSICLVQRLTMYQIFTQAYPSVWFIRKWLLGLNLSFLYFFKLFCYCEIIPWDHSIGWSWFLPANEIYLPVPATWLD